MRPTVRSFFLLTALVLPAPRARTVLRDPLHLSVFVGDSASFHVTATLIYGPTEAILVDAQFRTSQATKLADQVQATGRRLKAIFITHPDDDHYIGIAVLHQRFPDAPIYMTAAALAEFKRTSARYLAGQRSYAPAETPDSLPTPDVLPSTHLTLDGEPIEVVTDLQGDAFVPSNSFIWVPSLRAVVAGDIVFNGVHVWLANSNQRTRAAWQHSLERLAALHPLIVVAGHKQSAEAADSPDAIQFMRDYLGAFDEAVRPATNADEVVAAMKRRYPDLGMPLFLNYASRIAVPN